jgi:hypothetical protein
VSDIQPQTVAAGRRYGLADKTGPESGLGHFADSTQKAWEVAEKNPATVSRTRVISIFFPDCEDDYTGGLVGLQFFGTPSRHIGSFRRGNVIEATCN